MAAHLDTSVTLRDGRRLAYTEWGNPAGWPVMYCHGMPGGRIWCPDEAATVAAGVRLIIPDRPGIGGSDPKQRRTFADWPGDVIEFADALGIGRFAIVGVSAGGPYAAACAALIPSRLTDVAIVSSRPLSRDNWEERSELPPEWGPDWQAEFKLVREDPVAGADLAAASFAPWMADIDEHPERLHEELEQAEGDRWFFADSGRAATFDAHVREAWRQGLDAVKWELVAAYLPWGFRLADISIPVRIWHGAQDPWVSMEHIDFQVARIPRTSLVVWEDSGHLGFVKHWAEIMTTIVGRSGTASRPIEHAILGSGGAMGLLDGRKALIFGVANDHSIAWGIARAFHEQGATVGFSSVESLIEKRVRPLATSIGSTFVEPCDVQDDVQIRAVFEKWRAANGELDILVHALAFAKREDLEGGFTSTSREGFALALDVSAYSLVALVREARPLLHPGSSVMTLTYYGAEKVVANYNVMGVAKAALEASVRYLAADLGPDGIRVNAISAGPIRTLAAAGIAGFKKMYGSFADTAPLRANITPEDVGRSAVYLASDLSSAVTGEVIYVDGGFNVMGVPVAD